jgi:hypothetical protein
VSNGKLNRKSAAQQNADVRISDRGGYAYGELGRSGKTVGIIPFGTTAFRDDDLNLVPRGTPFYNIEINALQISDPDNISSTAEDGWVSVSGSGSVSGTPGSGSNVVPGLEHETLRWNGTEYVPSDALLNDGTDIFVGNDLTVSGSVSVLGPIISTGAMILASGTTPTSTADPAGTVGEVRWDDDYIYIKKASGWQRMSTAIF